MHRNVPSVTHFHHRVDELCDSIKSCTDKKATQQLAKEIKTLYQEMNTDNDMMEELDTVMTKCRLVCRHFDACFLLEFQHEPYSIRKAIHDVVMKKEHQRSFDSCHDSCHDEEGARKALSRRPIVISSPPHPIQSTSPSGLHLFTDSSHPIDKSLRIL